MLRFVPPWPTPPPPPIKKIRCFWASQLVTHFDVECLSLTPYKDRRQEFQITFSKYSGQVTFSSIRWHLDQILLKGSLFDTICDLFENQGNMEVKSNAQSFKSSIQKTTNVDLQFHPFPVYLFLCSELQSYLHVFSTLYNVEFDLFLEFQMHVWYALTSQLPLVYLQKDSFQMVNFSVPN